MNVDGAVVSDAAGTEIVWVGRAGLFQDGVTDESLLFFGKRLLQKFFNAWHGQFTRHLDHEETDDDGCQRVKNAPLLSQDNRAANADSRADAGKGITAVVPGVGDNGLRMKAAPAAERVAEEHFLGENGDECGNQCHPAGTTERSTVHPVVDLNGGAPEDTDADGKEHEPDGRRGKGLIFAMPKIVIGIAWFPREADKGNDNDVGQEIGK